MLFGHVICWSCDTVLFVDNIEAVSNMTDGDTSSGQIVVVDADAVVSTLVLISAISFCFYK